VFNATSSIFGGFFDSTVHLKQDLQNATLDKAHNKAFEEAEAEVKSHFLQCPKCSRFLCNKCWDSEKDLCNECEKSVDGIK